MTDPIALFNRLYRQAYLRHWSLGWLALVVYVGASVVVRLSGGGGPHLMLVAVALVAAACATARPSASKATASPWLKQSR